MGKKDDKALAADLRNLARDYERDTRRGFTCNAIEIILGEDARDRYSAAYQFGYKHGGIARRNEKRLWGLESDEEHAVRILLLCFAAAMAETGDL